MRNRTFGRRVAPLFGGVLATVIVVKGIMALVPDAIMLDKYGDVRGVFQLGLAVVAIAVFSASWRWLDGID